MAIRIGTGPVFEAECLTASRRPQFYWARVLLVASLLVGLVVVWVSKRDLRLDTVQGLASIGSAFYTALMGVELTLALTVAPAAAAGAICLDRARGGLALMMTTDLSDSEVVLGRLASRLLSTLGVVACGTPVLALATLLGGVDPVAVAGGTLVVVGVAALSVGMALTFSLWASKPHEALSATYAVWAIWTLALLAWDESIGSPPEFLRWSNPFWLLFSSWGQPSDRMLAQVVFFGGSLLATALLAGLSTWMLRSVTLRKAGRSPRKKRAVRPGREWLRRIGQAAPRLDDDPILWREWHRKRPSPFARAIWWTYAVISTAFTIAAMFGPNIAPGVNGFQVSIGLLLVSVGAATALAEERAQGGLDVVLATPLASRAIVLGKWWGAYRVVPRLAILPGLLVLVRGLLTISTGEALVITGLVVGLVLAYGAVIVGLGLLVAIAQPRPGRAAAIGVACYLGLTVAYPAAALPLLRNGPSSLLPLWPSPFFGPYIPTCIACWGRNGPWQDLRMIDAYLFLAAVAFAGLALRWAALLLFDRGLGRVRVREGHVTPLSGKAKIAFDPDFISDVGSSARA